MYLLSLVPLIYCLVSSASARNSHRASEHHTQLAKRAATAHLPNNGTFSPFEDPNELQKRDGTKYVFMHHIVGNTYPYTQADWTEDIQLIQAKGVDALALNIGGDGWQRTQIASAYAAAAALGTGFKLFISFDFTAMGCDVNDIIGRVNQFAHHSNQFLVNGKPMISSYSGDCLGPNGWATLKAQTNGYLMPFIWGLEGQFNNWPALDSWYCWGCAWPQGNYPKNTDDDNFYISQLGSRYATTVGAWMFTHLSYKNFYLRGDDWLPVTRWEQIMAMRNQLTFVEMVTWNDYGESDYYGPYKGAAPDGTTWAADYPHTAWYDMSEYFIRAFKTGVYPAITQDVIYYWARPHPAGATASNDPLGKPNGWSWTEDSMWVAVFATATSSVTLKCGSSSQTFTVNAGVTKLKIPLAAGQITVQMVRNGQTLINKTPSDYHYVLNPTIYNYNAYVGSAKGTDPSPTSSSTTPTPTPTTPTGFTSLGCVAEGTTGSRRALTGASFTQSDMTQQKCQTMCAAFTYAGVEYGTECYCGNSLTNNGATGTVISSDQCNVPCAGNGAQTCGGSWTLTVFTQGSPPSSPQWTSRGCYVDNSARILRGAFTTSATMSTDECVLTCNAQGFTMAATEYSTQCMCGSQLFVTSDAGFPSNPSDCNMACAGNAGQTCGGGWRANVYTKPGTNI